MIREGYLLGFVVGLFMVGCVGAAIQHAMDAYAAGRYRDAEEQLASLESDTPDMNPKGYVRYCVYRGLTLRELGDMASGCNWLLKGQAAYDRGNPAWLFENIQAKMNEALDECRGADRAELVQP